MTASYIGLKTFLTDYQTTSFGSFAVTSKKYYQADKMMAYIFFYGRGHGLLLTFAPVGKSK